MPKQQGEQLRTRASLLACLKDWQDNASWQKFFDTYWKLIYGVARKGNLSDVEAQDVVQEVMVHVARQMPTFQYDPAIGSFKSWLLIKTRWCIAKQHRQHGRAAAPAFADSAFAPVEQIADPSVRPIEEIWEEEWQRTLMEAALARLKTRCDPLNLQIFDFCALKGVAPKVTAVKFGVSVKQVYVIKHRIREALKHEVEQLEREIV